MPMTGAIENTKLISINCRDDMTDFSGRVDKNSVKITLKNDLLSKIASRVTTDVAQPLNKFN